MTRKGGKGWWADHEYDRRSVAFTLPSWPGWNDFMEMLTNPAAPYLTDSEKYACVLFETGCRETEAIKLKPDQFKWNDKVIVISNVTVLKKKRKFVRDVVIKLDERNPLGQDLIEYVEACETDYLLPGFGRGFRSGGEREVHHDRHVSPKTVYNRITELSPKLWPHALRGYRASMLVYERDFSIQDFMGWFEWQSADSAAHYTKTRDVAKSMGIKKKDMPK